MFDRSLLPESLFVPFDASPLTTARVAMDNTELENDVGGLLERYAFVVVDRGRRGKTRKTFYAERYGAIGRNPQGGGARVGTDFAYQVKGIGRTPLLAARRIDRAYATGDMPLGEAIREHIWGEVLHRVLPYGAVRSAMVIDSGERCVRPGEPDPSLAPRRGLLVRQCALRPAHFIRSAYHQKPARLKIPHDRVRVEEALQALHAVLPVRASTTGEAATASDRLLQGIAGFTERLARQQAVARARRFMHGAITPSNLCIDARWLDYDSVSRPPVYASCRHFRPGFWDDHLAVYTVLDSLWFHVRKYIDFPATTGFRENSLVDLYHHRFSEELRLAFLEPTGFPLELLDDLDEAALDRARVLGTILVQLAKDGTLQPFPGEAEDMAGYGTYDMPRIAATLAGANAADAERRLAPSVPGAATRTRLVDAYMATRRDIEFAASRRGWPEGSTRRLTTLGAHNLSRPLALLNGPGLMQRIDEQLLCLEGVSLRRAAHALLDGIVRDLSVTFRDTDREGMIVVGNSASVTTYDARAHRWSIASGGRTEVVPDSFMTTTALNALIAGHEAVACPLEEPFHA